MDNRSRRIKSLLIRQSNLDRLTDPIVKSIKPNQVYNDYFLPKLDKKKDFAKELSPNIQIKRRNQHSEDFEHSFCRCNCHKTPEMLRNSSISSTATSKRSKINTPSPIKSCARELIRRNMTNQNKKNFSVFPYGGLDIRKDQYRLIRKSADLNK